MTATHYNNFYLDGIGQQWVDPCGLYMEDNPRKCITCGIPTHRLDTCLEEFFCALPDCIAVLRENFGKIEELYGKHDDHGG